MTDSQILLDKKVHHKLKNGQLKPSRILDLHGLRYEEARSKVIVFINTVFQQNQRLVLIITGKGKKPGTTLSFYEEERNGVLKQALPSWLKSNQVKAFILNITPAHVSHGGDGAVYVYLRKNKNHST